MKIIFAIILFTFATIPGVAFAETQEVPFVTVTNGFRGGEDKSFVLSVILDEAQEIQEFAWTYYPGGDEEIEKEIFTTKDSSLDFEFEDTKVFTLNMIDFSPVYGAHIVVNYLHNHFSREWKSMEFDLVVLDGEWVLIGEEEDRPIQVLHIVPKKFLFITIGIKEIVPSYHY